MFLIAKFSNRKFVIFIKITLFIPLIFYRNPEYVGFIFLVLLFSYIYSYKGIVKIGYKNIVEQFEQGIFACMFLFIINGIFYIFQTNMASTGIHGIPYGFNTIPSIAIVYIIIYFICSILLMRITRYIEFNKDKNIKKLFLIPLYIVIAISVLIVSYSVVGNAINNSYKYLSNHIYKYDDTEKIHNLPSGKYKKVYHALYDTSPYNKNGQKGGALSSGNIKLDMVFVVIKFVIFLIVILFLINLIINHNGNSYGELDYEEGCIESNEKLKKNNKSEERKKISDLIKPRGYHETIRFYYKHFIAKARKSGLSLSRSDTTKDINNKVNPEDNNLNLFRNIYISSRYGNKEGSSQNLKEFKELYKKLFENKNIITVFISFAIIFLTLNNVYTANKAQKVQTTSSKPAKIAVVKKSTSKKLNKKDEVVPMKSPKDWRDQIIYFILTDRFYDGDKSNDDQGCGEYGADLDRYNGGDLKGIADKVDYIKGLGATAVWITPPVANQWVNESGYGYHGYSAENFKKVDKHMGTLKSYRDMSNKLHSNGLFLIQDIVVNHTGDFFSYTTYDPKNPRHGWRPTSYSKPVSKPSQKPFDENNPNKYLKQAIYHFTPILMDFNDDNQLKNYQLDDLDDLNTENPVVQETLKDSYRYWIKNVGIDGVRIDTARHVQRSFWDTFLHSNGKSEGLKPYAKSLGKNDFLCFGEDFNISNEDCGSYTGKNMLDSTLDFPLQNILKLMFIGNEPTSIFTENMQQRTKSIYKDPSRLVTFIDNHDMNRWLASGNVDNMKAALTIIMTVPGIPAIYYGTEQEIMIPREAMFKEGYNTADEDRFNTHSRMYKFIQKLSNIRKKNKVLSRGKIKVIRDCSTGPGILAYTMTYGRQKALIVFNTTNQKILAGFNKSNHKILANRLDVGINKFSGMKLAISGKDSLDKEIYSDQDGKVSFELGDMDFGVYLLDNTKQSVSKRSNAKIDKVYINNNQELSYKDVIKSKITSAQKVYAYIDGNNKNMMKATKQDGYWNFNLNYKASERGKHYIIIKAVDRKGRNVFSDSIYFSVVKYYPPYGKIAFVVVTIGLIVLELKKRFL